MREFPLVNKKLKIFFLIFLILLGGVYLFTKTAFFEDKFASLATLYVKKRITKDLAFKKIKINYFPLGIKVEQIQYAQKDIVFKAEKAQLYFDLGELLLGKNYYRLQVESFSLQGKFEKDKKRKKLKEEEVIAYYQKGFQGFLISNFKKIELLKGTLYQNNEGYPLKSLKIVQGKQYIDLEVKNHFFRDKKKIKSFAQIRAYRKEIFFKKIFLENNQSKINSFLNLKIKNKKLSVNGNFNGRINLADFPLLETQGDFTLRGEILGNLAHPQFFLRGNGKSILGRYIKAPEISIDLKYQNKKVVVNKLRMTGEEKSFSEIKDFILYDAQKNIFLPQPIYVQNKNYNLKDVLYYVKKEIAPLYGKFHGPVLITLKNKKVTVKTLPGFFVTSLEIKTKKDKIIKVKKMDMKPTSFVIHRQKVHIFGESSIEGKVLNYDGTIYRGTVSFLIKNSFFDFKNLNIKKIKASGEAFFNGEIKTVKDDVLFSFAGQGENIVFNDLVFKKADFSFDISVLKKFIEFQNLSYQEKKKSYQAQGKIYFANKPGEIRVGINKMTFQDVDEVLHRKIKFSLLKKMRGGFSGKMKLDFKGSDLINTELDFSAREVYFFKEYLERLTGHLNLQGTTLKISDLRGQKKKGKINAELNYETTKNELVYQIALQSPLKDIDSYNSLPFNLQGDLDLQTQGIWRDKIKKQSLKVSLKKVTLNKTAQKPLHFYWDQDQDFLKWSFLWDTNLKISNEKTAEKSKTLMSCKNFDPGNLLSIFATNKQKSLQKGRCEGGFTYEIDLKNPKKSYFDLAIKNLMIALYEKKLIYQTVEKWQFNQGQAQGLLFFNEGGRPLITINQRGKIGRDYRVRFSLFLDSEIAKLFDAKFTQSRGSLIWDYYPLKQTSHVLGKDLFLEHRDLERPLSQFNFEFKKNKELFQVNSLKFNFSGGLFTIDQGYYRYQDHKIFAPYSFSKIKLQLQDKSWISLDGAGNIGNNLKITGNYNITGGIISPQIKNEIKGKVKNRFMPKIKKNSHLPIALDINFQTQKRVEIRNEYVDAGVIGSGKILGTAKNPLLHGLFTFEGPSYLVLNQNKFLIKQGSIEYQNQSIESIPHLKVQAEKKIKEYVVGILIDSRERKNKQLAMYSRPGLKNEEILSLILNGSITDQNKISASEINRINTAGVGGYLLQELQINNKFMQALGFNVNIDTEFEESTNLGNYNIEADNSFSALNSGTAVSISKKISPQTALKFSTTLGDSNIGDKQKVGFSYKINENIQGLLIYEVRTNNISSQEVNNNSAGGEINFEWSF